MGAAYVVTGSVTELAGRYSLDVHVTPAAVALGGRTLVLTAERDEELQARVNEVADGVLASVLESAPAVVAKVELVGAERRGEALRSSLAHASRASPSIRPACATTSRSCARIPPSGASAPRRSGGRMGSTCASRSCARTACSAAATRRGASGSQSVTVRGNRRIEASAILARVGTKVGARYSPAQIARDVREVQSLGFFRNVRVFTDQSPDGMLVIFDVEESPVVRQITISGNESIDSEKIRDILTLTTGSTLDYPLLFENRERISALYRAEGYYLATVGYGIEPLGEAGVSINFEVTEGGKLKLRDIDFVGNEHFSSRQLREGFQTQVWHFWSLATSWFDHSGTYSEPLFVQDLRGVEKKYTDAGYLRVEVGEPNVVADKNGLVVTVAITEGQRFKVGKLDIAGDDTVDIAALHDLLELHQGDIFNRSFLTEDVARLTEYYADRGFYFANVTPLSNLSASNEVVDVTFQVRKGPLYFVRNIDVSGNTLTVDSVVRREIPIVEGQLYSQRQVMLARGRIERLGFFEEVDLRMEPTDAPEQLDMNVKVVEHPTGSFSFGAGYSSQDGIVVTGSLAQSNLFGRGYNTQFTADVGGQTTRFFLSFSDPYVFGSDFSLGTTLFRTDLQYQDFQQTQTGVELVLGHSLSEDNRTRGLLRYSFSERQLDENQNVYAAGVILRELVSGAITSSLAGVSLLSDTRNDRFSPTAGLNLGATIEYSGLGFFTNFARFEGRATWFMGAPSWLPERSTFVVGTRLGWTLPFNTIGDYDLPNVQEIRHVRREHRTVEEHRHRSEAAALGALLPGRAGRVPAARVRGALGGPPARDPLRDTGDGAVPAGGAHARDDRHRDRGRDSRPKTSTRTTRPRRSPPSARTGRTTGGNGNGKCNNISDHKINQFADLSETDVIGGNKFISSTFEYRFPISDTIGLQGVAFFDTGNAFAEDENNLFDVTNWRYGTGVGVQWFSPFGPLAVVIGFPLDPLSVEKTPVFEFSVGGQGF